MIPSVPGVIPCLSDAAGHRFVFTILAVVVVPLLDTNPEAVRADAYDMVINGIEVGGGSIRIHDQALQAKMFEILGFTPERAQAQFGFLMNAFKFGAPPHGGLA